MFKKLIYKIRHGMILNVIIRRLDKIGIEINPFYWIREAVDPKSLENIKGKFKDYTFNFFGPEEMKIIGQFPDRSRGLREEKLIERLDEGKKCFGAKFKGEIAAFTWFNFNECTFPHCYAQLKQGEAYLFDMFVHPKFRGKNLAPYLRYQQYLALQEMGIKSLYSVSEYFNKPAVNFKKKLNANFLEAIWYIKLFNKWEWRIVKPAKVY